MARKYKTEGITDRLSLSMLITWMCIRGNRPRFLFSTATDKYITRTYQTFPINEFKNFFPKILGMCGVGAGDVKMCSGHSHERGCIQLHWPIGISDAQIGGITKMAGDQFHENYCAS